MAKNYTPINDLVEKYKRERGFYGGEISGASKEAEPILTRKESFAIKEVVEKELPKELTPYVEEREEKVKIDEELRKLGLRPVSGTIKFPDYKNLQFPISDEKILEGLHAPISSSLRWLSEFAVYILKKFHIKLKKIHGKVVRVFTG